MPLMTRDEREIRQLVSTWMSATQAGDIDTVLSLMPGDAGSHVTGRPSVRKTDVAAAAKPQAGADAPKFDGRSDIQEIQVLGEWAFMWTKLKVVVAPPGGAPPIARSGYTLSVLRKQN